MNCPICGHTESEPLLTLLRYPIYQHPVPPEASITQPWFIDLHYRQCLACQHAWQPDFDADVLSRIYENHYYTPSPDGVGAQFRDDFMAVMERFGLAVRSGRSLLEIGASSGDALSRLRDAVGSREVLAYEPNHENAARARERGLPVREEFFCAEGVAGLPSFDLIFARHVIEHIFDFDDVLSALRQTSREGSDLVLETPCLDWHVQQESTAPFHVEHNHVFSIRSLAKLGERGGWGCEQYAVSEDGNLIMWFRRQLPSCDMPTRMAGANLQSAMERRVRRLSELLDRRKLLFWGAGSASCKLISLLGRDPEYLVDGNPGKAGKVFVGSARHIAPAEETLRQIVALPSEEWPVVVIASSFDREIRARLGELGWKGEVLSLYGPHANDCPRIN